MPMTTMLQAVIDDNDEVDNDGAAIVSCSTTSTMDHINRTERTSQFESSVLLNITEYRPSTARGWSWWSAIT